ncbi:MAG: hypothetical protein Q7T36_05380 [Fluviicoccus sp.]|uniref:hypothetical protein n=1 Tax=Fluviicoccus sp. TaxID=2003552 RepID=UPI002719085A|nr:hypothetical protein [Fluviicoccus sp.]MDO8329887.1 hypothetical protein [Fluviicoccus sp.]
MFLNLKSLKSPVKLVYQLSLDLKANPARVTKAQALTLDQSRPLFGLKGTYGLFGSQEWWDNIVNGKMPRLYLCGDIIEIYKAGLDGDSEDDIQLDFKIMTSDGDVCSESFEANDVNDYSLFKLGAQVHILYVLDPLKDQSPLGNQKNYSNILLEMAVEDIVGSNGIAPDL